MKQVFRIIPFAALLFVGAGCALFPHIVRVPPASNSQETALNSVDQTKPIAYLQLNGGAATVTRGSETVQAQEDTELIAGDRIQVSSGDVMLVYPDAGESDLSAGADVVLTSDGPGTGDVFTELRVVAGDVWTRFERLLGSNEHFSVEANGVVATVRGTAFGMSVQGEDVDVQVADHFVDVTAEQDENVATAPQAIPTMHLTNGQGFHVSKSQLKQYGMAKMAFAVRQLDKKDKQKKGFVFGTTKISSGKMKKPLKPVKLDIAPAALPPDIQQRMQLLHDRLMIQMQTQGFVAPTAAPSLSPDGTPSVSGPSSTGQ